jgi:Gpi18-like mannosyltransferase
MEQQQLIDQQQFIVIFIIAGIIFLAAMQYIYSNRQRGNTLVKKQDHIWIFIGIAAFALIVRMIIAYQMPGYKTDVDCFRAWAVYAYDGGLGIFYNGDFFADYPPLYVYLLSFLGFIRDAAGIDASSAGYGLMVKMPAMILDIVFAYFIYRLAEKEINAKAGLFLSALVLLNPAVMANSALWGQVDIFITVLMVLTLYMLYKNKLFLSSVLFLLALLLKPQAIMIAPVLLFVFIRNIIVSKDKLKAFLLLAYSLLAMAALFFIIPLPFGMDKEPLWLVGRFMETMSQYQYASLNAMNVYSLAGLNFAPYAEHVFLGLPLNVWGFIFVGVICVYALWLYIKNPSRKYIFIVAAFIVYSVFEFTHSMHERYLFVVPILMLVAYIFIRDRRLLSCTLMVFGILLVNQCISLYYYQMVIPAEACIAVSAIGLAVYAYTAYVFTMLALKPPVAEGPFLKEDEDGGSAKGGEAKAAYAQLRPIRQGRRIARKDVFFMVVITAVYSIVAFTNLGSFTIPESMAAVDGEVVVEFQEPESIAKIKYYADYGRER